MQYRFNLQKVLKEKDITVAKLSRMSDVSLSTLTRYNHNKSNSVNSVALAKICKALDCKIQDLLVIDK